MAETINQPAAAPTSPADAVPRPQTPGKSEAERLLSDALRQLAQLESEGVRAWGMEKLHTNLPEVQANLDKANALFDRQQYVASLPVFRKAIAGLNQLADSMTERFRAAMERGKKAYDARNAEEAVSQLQIATALVPGDQDATTLLGRARKLPEVLAKVRAGETLEADGRLDDARDSYRTSLSLDAAFEPAKAHLDRIDDKIKERDYQNALSTAFEQLDLKNFKSATSALQRAKQIKPSTAEVRELTSRIAAATQLSALERLRDDAIRLEAQEKWAAALATYEKALNIDNGAAFAARGQEKAQNYLALHKAIDQYLSNPSRLQSPEPRLHAKSLLVHSETLAESGPVLQSKRGQLEKLITHAETPSPVTLLSDSRTEVTIYRVGQFGVLSERHIELQPGKYTAVGIRPGYRDVRVEFEVIPGGKETVITVQCTEPI